ncbi:M1 family metallopeptidase [Nocardioides sp. GY 10113]|uniref:M1 family metallopeptidase n=1 Tax=Nocardioides sp. GY 10113 TaxID=2569761 RepID=UPI0010A7B8C8|nr:M1 family metallopeptidase [Nocardioides sp. GY 10113]TIC79660.1 M1 family metallopeptidase [Nocardioides sp. GY 10113]TIC85785.1 M1 family metallopeptidase [Nocardioides sp. GY 10113]
MPNSLPTADPYLPGHGDPAYRVHHYDLEIGYTVDGNRLDGTAVLDLEVLEPTRRIVLDLIGLSVGKVRLTGAARLRRFDHRDGRLVLTLAAEAAPGDRMSATVRYSGKPAPVIDRHHGDAGWEELTDGSIVAAQPHGAPTWFPCNDRAGDKATYAIAVTAPAGYHVVANGELAEHRRRGSAETWSYVMDRPMSTYLATVQIGRYRVREHRAAPGTPPIRTVVPEALPAGLLAGCFDQQPAMMEAFQRWFGPYPFTSYAAVVTDDDLEIPLESQGLSTFGRNFCSTDWSQVRLIAHELAHQWFGNAVTLARQRDIWLHEGFACYSEWLWSEESGGPRSCDGWARHHHARLVEARQDLLLADPGPELMFDDRVYKRGALALHALRRSVGDDAFFAVLRGWVERYAGGSVTTEDFLAFAGESTGADVAALLDPWLNRTALPPYPA